MMKPVYLVKYEITDKGITYPVKEEEIIVPRGQDVVSCLGKHLRKYRHAQDLSKSFTFKVIERRHNGYCN